MESNMVKNMKERIIGQECKKNVELIEPNYVESNMVKNMKKLIKELEQEKQSITFYENNKAILTAPAEEFFLTTKSTASAIPVSFIFALHNIANSRNLYVFDFLDIMETHGRYPEDFDPERYAEFVRGIDAALMSVGLSVNMKMNQQQREYFDAIVRKREQEDPLPGNLSFESWYRLIRQKIFAPVPELGRPYLAKKHKEELIILTKSVMEKCHRLRLSDKEVREYLSEAMKEEGIRYSSLVSFSWEEFEKYQRNVGKEKMKMRRR